MLTQFFTDTEKIVGCYRNDSGSTGDWIVFATDGVSATFDGEWRHIPYQEIVKVVREGVKDVDSDDVRLEIRSQNIITMLVRGKNTAVGTHDKYSIMMFLEHVIGELDRSN